MKKAAVAILHGLLWTLVVLASMFFSIGYHLQLDAAHEEVRELVNSLASDALRGDLEIGSIDDVSYEGVRASHVVLRDQEGREVISAPTVFAQIDFGALLRDGTIRIGHGAIDSAELTLYVVGDEGLEMSFIRAFEPAHPGPPGGEPLHLVIGDLVLTNVHAHGDVPRYPGIDLEGVNTTLRIEVHGNVLVDAYSATGRMIGPYPGVTEIDNIRLHLDTDWHQGVTAYARVHRGEANATADVWVDRPDGWSDQGPPRIRIIAHADPMCAETLRSMGFPGLDSFAGCARGWAQLTGPADALVLAADLTTDAGDVTVTGNIPSGDQMSFALATPGLDLRTLIPVAPEMRIAGSGTVRLVDDPTDPTRAIVTISSDAFTVDDYAIPGFDATAAVTSDALLIERVDAHYLRGTLDVSGRVGFDGALDLEADIDLADIGADPNVARLVPGAHGSVRGHVRIDSGPAAAHLTIDSTLEARNFRYGPLRAQSLRGRVWARIGERPLPELSLGLTGEGVSVSGVSLGHATISGAGGGSRPLRVQVRSTGGTDIRAASVDATVRRSADGTITIDLDSTSLDVGLGEYRAAPDTHPRITVRHGELQFDDFDLRTANGEGTTLSGRLAPSGDSDLTIHLREFDLATIAPLLPPTLQQLTGRLDADGTLRGRLADPDLEVSGNIHDASFDGQRGLTITHYGLHYEGARTAISLDGDLGSRGGVHIDGAIDAPFAVLTNATRFVREARFDGLEIDIDRANIAFIVPFLGQRVVDYGLGGRVTAAVVLSGPIVDIDIPRAIMILDEFGPEGWTPIRAKARFSYVGDALRVERIWIADPIGELLLAEAGTQMSIVDPPADGPGWLARLSEAPWWIALRIEPRRLDGWPRPLGKVLPRGIVVGGSVTLMGDSRGTSGSLEAVVRWDEAATSAPCAADLRPNLQVHATTDADVTHIRVDGFLDGQDVLQASADAPTHIRQWLASSYAELPPTALHAHLVELPLASLPWACAYATGTAGGDLEMTLGSDQPALDGTLDVANLRVRDPEDGVERGDPVHAAISFATEGSNDTRATMCLLVSEENGARTPIAQCPTISALEADEHALSAEEGEVAIALAVPIRFDGRLSVPSVVWEAPLFFWGDFGNAHLAPLMAFIPGIVDADLVANGTVSARGPYETATFEGGLDLRDGHARIVSVGQHLHAIGGVLRLEPGRLVLPEDRPLTVSDGDGTVSVTGALEFEGLSPVHANLVLTAASFPVRREGATLASITGATRAEIRITQADVDVDVHAGQLAITLPQSLAGSVQSLDRRRDVLLVGDDAPELVDGGHASFPYRIHVLAPAFTVSRNDFSADVRADLEVTYDDPDLTIGGVAEITNGTFEVLGKRFTVQHGAIVFDAGPEMDPDISVVAVYALPGRRGATITVTVSGRLSSLSVDFSSTESSDTGEILALLVSGRTSRPQDASSAQQAGDQTANFVAGLTAGILTLGLQQQFGGDFVPNVAVEAGNLGSVGVRVGFNADWIIPDFLRDIVLDAYLEGFFGSTSTQQQQQQQQQGGGSGGVSGGASIELQLPFNGVLSGTYVPPTSWGSDLVWEP